MFKDYLRKQGIFNRQDCLCVLLEKGGVRAALVTAKVGYGVVRTWSKGLGRQESLQQLLAEILREETMKNCRQLLFILPETEVLLKCLTMPVMPQQELREALRWEAQQYAPWREGTYELAIQTGQVREEQQLVLLAAVPMAMLNSLRQLSRELKLNLLGVTVRPLAQAAFLQQQKENFLLMQAEDDYCNLKVFLDGLPVLAERSAYDAESAAKAIERLTESCAENYGVVLRDIFFSGKQKLWPQGLQIFGGREYCLTQVAFAGSFSWQGALATPEERETYANQCLDMAGAALLTEDQENWLNFCGSSRQAVFWTQWSRRIAVVVLVCLTVSCGALYAWQRQQAEQLNALASQLADLEMWQQRYLLDRQQKQQLQFWQDSLQHLRDSRLCWGELLSVFGRTVPENCWLTGVEQKEKGELLVSGKAEDGALVQQLLVNWQQSGKFAAAELTGAGAGENGRQNFTVKLRTGGQQDE